MSRANILKKKRRVTGKEDYIFWFNNTNHLFHRRQWVICKEHHGVEPQHSSLLAMMEALMLLIMILSKYKLQLGLRHKEELALYIFFFSI